VEILSILTTQTLNRLIKNITSLHERIVGGHTGSSEHGPKNWERMLANFFAGIIVGFFRTLISIFSTIFRMLLYLAG